MTSSTTADCAIHAALWGPPSHLFDAIDLGAFRVEMFTGDTHRDIARHLLAIVVDEGDVPTVAQVHRRLLDDGYSHVDAVDAVLLPGAFDASGYRVSGLLEHLAELDLEHERQRLEERLVSLADRLHRPDGLRQVRRIIGEVAS